MKITVKADVLVVLLEGMERLWALKPSICIKAHDIVAIHWDGDRPSRWGLGGIRIIGTGAPGLLYAGHFYRNHAKEFWYLRAHEAGQLIIETKLKKYRYIRLSADEATGFEIMNWFSKIQETRKLA